MHQFARIAVIANPAARSGAGIDVAQRIVCELRSAMGADACDLFPTEYAQHAIDIVRTLHPTYRTVIAVGGDGTVHEVVNGLMARNETDRPRFGLIPFGSGNDYAATLGMSAKPDRALKQLLEFNITPADVGCVNGEYFAETLSFGLDAAIALDTVERRQRTGRTGTLLYLESAIAQLFGALRPFQFGADMTGFTGTADRWESLELSGTESANDVSARNNHPVVEVDVELEHANATDLMDAAEVVHDSASVAAPQRFSGETHLFAVQIGPTYGGGFKVCPSARIDDGLFDVCLATPPLSSLSATGILLLAKGGHHTRFRQIHLAQASGVHVRFESELPAQADGERIRGREFDIRMHKHALSVLTGRQA
ncbi:diacylglycerol/lipid kinase family protein [Adlercreutzia sp. ZJ141]|uniref:diacylglycerol/lipid kinase family protein n=1 Tax=Adlercreutzia sp. ZJ141 TaxID=2709406 RepID=UPI001F150333|nr:diacylglycerol kinase family protein [Adlercreutzia sp. ZJ141]